MMISGIGADIVDLRRVRHILSRFPSRFPERILHSEEWRDYQKSRNPHRFLAKRFAAKEAVSKALGTGFANSVYTKNICIFHDAKGQPSVRLCGDCAVRYPNTEILLSLADEINYAIAYAIAVAEN